MMEVEVAAYYDVPQYLQKPDQHSAHLIRNHAFVRAGVQRLYHAVFSKALQIELLLFIPEPSSEQFLHPSNGNCRAKLPIVKRTWDLDESGFVILTLRRLISIQFLAG
jgi:hypothetical protein